MWIRMSEFGEDFSSAPKRGVAISASRRTKVKATCLRKFQTFVFLGRFESSCISKHVYFLKLYPESAATGCCSRAPSAQENFPVVAGPVRGSS